MVSTVFGMNRDNKMIRPLVATILLFIITVAASGDTIIRGDTLVSGVWDLDGSPYLIYDAPNVPPGDTLIIEPGVVVRFNWVSNLHIQNGVILARGTEEDSIKFIPQVDVSEWGAIWVTGAHAEAEFDYCYFLRGGTNWMNYGTIVAETGVGVTVRNSTFERCATVIGVFARTPLLVENCLFLNSFEPGVYMHQINENVVIKKSSFLEPIVVGSFCAISARGGIVENCLFINSTVSANLETYVQSSLFINIDEEQRPFIYAPGGQDADEAYVSFNCFYGEPEEPFPVGNHDESLENLGILDRVNANGDSTDRYGNLFMDPELVGGDEFPESYFLREDSPCIDAGDPEADPDPDSTVADIGPFFFPQCNIRVDPTAIEFVDAQAGRCVETELQVRNVGLRALDIIDLMLAPEDGPFGVDFDWEGVPPDSSVIIWVLFDPDQAGVYEAVLQIESNDRDEGLLEVPITGIALGIELNDNNLPSEFAVRNVYPNPFNSSTTITYALPYPSSVSMSVYNTQGRQITTMFEDFRQAGFHTATLNVEDLSSGLYFIRLETPGQELTRKITLIY